MKNKKIFFIFSILIIGVFAYYGFSNPEDDGDRLIATVYKSPTCGCCGLFTGYLNSKSDFKVKSVNMQDVSSIKRKYGVPTILESCHTTIIGNYFVEGHIPLEAINKLMNEKPDILGIGMPGMPSGSPGMPGKKTEDFTIFGVNKDGGQFVFMTL